MTSQALSEERPTLAERAQLGWPDTSYALFQRSAERWPDRPALTFVADPSRPKEARTYTYAELFSAITQAANIYAELSGDIAAYCLPNLAETHFALWGGEANGVAFALNPQLGGPQICNLLQSSGASVLTTTADIWSQLSTAGVSDTALTAVLIVGPMPDAPAPPGVKLLSFDTERDRASDERLARAAPPTALDPCSWFCTGGTTGAPKIAMRSHGAETGNAMALAASFDRGLSCHDVFLCGLPLFHVNATTATGLLPWSVGAHVILASATGYRDPRLLENFWRVVEAWGVSLFSGVPTIYARLMEQPIGDANISSLRVGICGAAPLTTELVRRFEALTGVRMLEGYGLTEGACVSTINPFCGERRIGSVGLSLPWQDVAIAELAEDGSFQRECETGEVGSILIAGLNLFDGYRDPAHERGVWVDRADGRRWLNTGDLGRIDADGYVWLTGRRKELIIRGGHNIDPAIIEEALNRHPAVALAAAAPRPDADVGELPVAYVQLRAPEAADEDALMAHARAEISERAAIPKAIRIVPALPLTAVGKIFKPALAMAEIEDVVRETAAAFGVRLKTVKAENDPQRGVVVRITANRPADALRSALSRYAFQTVITENGGHSADSTA